MLPARSSASDSIMGHRFASPGGVNGAVRQYSTEEQRRQARYSARRTLLIHPIQATR